MVPALLVEGVATDAFDRADLHFRTLEGEIDLLVVAANGEGDHGSLFPGDDVHDLVERDVLQALAFHLGDYVPRLDACPIGRAVLER